MRFVGESVGIEGVDLMVVVFGAGLAESDCLLSFGFDRRMSADADS